MGGAAEFPERASSPLKRSASSMDPESVPQTVDEDVDMVTVASDAMAIDTSSSSHQNPSNSTDVPESSSSLRQETQSAVVGDALATINDTSPGTSIN